MDEIYKWSDPHKVRSSADIYLGRDIPIYLSNKKNKKYMVQNPEGRWVHFGQLNFQDYTKHKDEDRRRRYLARATNIKGNWKDDKYSANNLAINLLWM